MIKIKDYSEQIDILHQEGLTALEIARKLNLPYCQPVYNYFKKRGWKRLSREEYRYNRKYKVDESFFEEIDTEQKAYVFGFICADGHVSIKNNRITIALQQNDVDILYKIRAALQATHPIVQNIKKENPYKKTKNQILYQARLTINGHNLIKPLLKRGLNNRKTYTLNGSEIADIPKELMRHFLRGYFDGDGNIFWGKQYASGKKYLVSVCGNENFLEATFQKYCPSNNKLYKSIKAKQCYSWKISNKEKIIEFLHYLYADASIYLERKYKIYQFIMWSCKTGLIAGNSYFINLIKGQSAANPLVKCWRQVQRLIDETFPNPYGEEYNSNTNAQQFDEHQIEDIV